MMTRAGTNLWHGGAREYFQNYKWDALDFFRVPRRLQSQFKCAAKILPPLRPAVRPLRRTWQKASCMAAVWLCLRLYRRGLRRDYQESQSVRVKSTLSWSDLWFVVA